MLSRCKIQVSLQPRACPSNTTGVKRTPFRWHRLAVSWNVDFRILQKVPSEGHCGRTETGGDREIPGFGSHFFPMVVQSAGRSQLARGRPSDFEGSWCRPAFVLCEGGVQLPGRLRCRHGRSHCVRLRSPHDHRSDRGRDHTRALCVLVQERDAEAP